MRNNLKVAGIAIALSAAITYLYMRITSDNRTDKRTRSNPELADTMAALPDKQHRKTKAHKRPVARKSSKLGARKT